MWCIFKYDDAGYQSKNLNRFLSNLGRLFLDQSWSAVFWVVCQSFVAIGDWTGRTGGCHGAIPGHAHVHYLRFAKNRHESSWTSACPGPASQKGNILKKYLCGAMFCLLPVLIYLCVMVCITDFLCSRPVERQECCIFVIVCVFPTQKYRGSLPNATFGPGEKSH